MPVLFSPAMLSGEPVFCSPAITSLRLAWLISPCFSLPVVPICSSASAFSRNSLALRSAAASRRASMPLIGVFVGGLNVPFSDLRSAALSRFKSAIVSMRYLRGWPASICSWYAAILSLISTIRASIASIAPFLPAATSCASCSVRSRTFSSFLSLARVVFVADGSAIFARRRAMRSGPVSINRAAFSAASCVTDIPGNAASSSRPACCLAAATSFSVAASRAAIVSLPAAIRRAVCAACSCAVFAASIAASCS